MHRSRDLEALVYQVAISRRKCSPRWSRFVLKDCSLWKDHSRAQEKSEEEGEADRDSYGLT